MDLLDLFYSAVKYFTNLNKAFHHLDRYWDLRTADSDQVNSAFDGLARWNMFNLLTRWPSFFSKPKASKDQTPVNTFYKREEWDQSNPAEVLWRSGMKYAVSPAGGGQSISLLAFMSHPQLLSLNAASGPDNWSWLVKWILSSIFKIAQLFSFLRNKTSPAGGWEFPTVTQEAKAWRQVWVGKLGKRGVAGEAGAALPRGHFLGAAHVWAFSERSRFRCVLQTCRPKGSRHKAQWDHWLWELEGVFETVASYPRDAYLGSTGPHLFHRCIPNPNAPILPEGNAPCLINPDARGYTETG